MTPFLDSPWSERRSGEPLLRTDDWRRWYDRDRGRLIHSAAFRRLQSKTQVLGVGEGDFHRTRLTHSLEVAQIAQGIVGFLAAHAAGSAAPLPPSSLIEAIALGHDLGHPPFGHGGEIALNWGMRDAGGFEGNGHTLRLLARLEPHSGAFGLDLARRTLLGVLKYPAPYSQVVGRAPPGDPGFTRANVWKPPKCFLDSEVDVAAWILDPFARHDRERLQTASPPGGATHGKPMHMSFDASIMNKADDIAFGVHDLEDAIALRLIGRDAFMSVWSSRAHAIVGLPGAPAETELAGLFADDSARKRAIGLLVNFFVIQVRVQRKQAFEHPLLHHVAVMDQAAESMLAALRDLVLDQVIRQPVVQMLEYRGQRMVQRIFETVAGDPERFLPASHHKGWREAADDRGRLRAVCDYVAGMADPQATRVYERLFVPRAGTAFERL